MQENKKTINLTPIDTNNLFNRIALLIEKSKHKIAVTINSELVLLNWNIGKLIQQNILKNKKPGYGENIICNLSEHLTLKFGKGWSKQQLWNCLYTVEIFPDYKIIYTLSGEFSWSHLNKLKKINK